MSVVLVFDQTSVYFGPVEVGMVSAVQTVTLSNTGTRTAYIDRGEMPVNFTGKYSTDPVFSDLIGPVKLGRPFIDGRIYYQAADGSITTDSGETGVSIGIGTADGTLYVTMDDIILDEYGMAILDESGYPLLAEP